MYCVFNRDVSDTSNNKNPHVSEFYLPKGAFPKLRMQVGSKMFPLKGEIGERESIGEFFIPSRAIIGIVGIRP